MLDSYYMVIIYIVEARGTSSFSGRKMKTIHFFKNKAKIKCRKLLKKICMSILFILVLFQ